MDTGTNERRTLAFGIVQAPLQKCIASQIFIVSLFSLLSPTEEVCAVATIAILFICYGIIYVLRYIKFFNLCI